MISIDIGWLILFVMLWHLSNRIDASSEATRYRIKDIIDKKESSMEFKINKRLEEIEAELKEIKRGDKNDKNSKA